MKIKKLVVLLLVAFSLLLFGCQNEGPAENAGKKIDNAIEKTTDKMGDAVEKAGDKMGNAVEKTGDELEEVGDSIKDSTN